MKPTIETTIRAFLKKRTWTFGGIIEDHIRIKLGSKGTTTSRALRQMAEDGSLDKTLEKIGRNWCVKYQLNK